MPTDRILTSCDGPVARIVFDNPEKRNAVSLAMWEEVERLLDLYREDPEVRILVLSGAGGKAFVSGADVSKYESERATREVVRHYNATTARVYGKIDAFPKPTVAQIEGFCVGGGVALAVCCDLRYRGRSSQFAIPAARLGLGYGFAGIRRLVNVVGRAFAKEIFFTARRFSAAEARAMGLVNAVLPDERVAAHVEETARTIAANAPLTVAQVKFTVGEVLKDPAERDLASVEAMVEACFASDDCAQGRRALLEKRGPVFQGS
jgi:enoyl-CoA hydratase/carnithine racemase